MQPAKPIAPQAKCSVSGMAKRDVSMQYSLITLSKHSSLINGILALKIILLSSVLLITYSARRSRINPVKPSILRYVEFFKSCYFVKVKASNSARKNVYLDIHMRPLSEMLISQITQTDLYDQ